MKTYLVVFSCVAAMALLVGTQAQAAAIEDFESYGTGTFSPGADWSLALGTSGTAAIVANSGPGANSKALQTTQTGTGNMVLDWLYGLSEGEYLQADFRLVALYSNYVRAMFRASTPDAGYTYGDAANTRFRNGISTGELGYSAANYVNMTTGLATGTWYTMQLQVVQDGDDTLIQGRYNTYGSAMPAWTTITRTDVTAPSLTKVVLMPAGTTEFDNLEIVPEPMTAMVLGVGGLVAVLVKRRRR